MQSSMLKAIVEDFGNGGTIDGDLVVSGDLTVSGGGSLSFDEIIEGTQVIDVTSTEALLVRKNGDGGDVFVVDTTNEQVKVGDNFIVNASGTTPVLTITGTRNDILFTESDTTNLNTLVRQQTGLFRIDTINDALDTVSRRFTIDHSTGNVSIGSAEDATKFLQFTRGGSGNGVVRGSIGTNNSKLSFIGGSGTTPHMTLDSSGQLGIGTTTPNVQNHIFGGSASQENILLKVQSNAVTNDGSLSTSILLANSTGLDSTHGAKIQAIRTGSGTDDLVFHTFNSSLIEAMRIDSSQNVAIGSSGSGYRLDVRGTGSTFFSQTTATSGSMARLRANNGSTSVLQINADGNIGIGTESPASLLHIEGDTPILNIRDSSAFSAGTGGAINFQGKDSNENVKAFAQVQGVSEGVNNGKLILQTRKSGTLTTALTIDTNQNASFNEDVIVGADAGSGEFAKLAFKANTSASGRYANITKEYDSPFTFQIEASSSATTAPIVFKNSNAQTALTLSSSADATFAGDVTISGGDMTLTGATTSIIGEQSAGANRGKIKFVTSGSDGDIVFETTTNGAGAITEAMRIDHNANVAIGSDSPIDGGGSKTVLTISDSAQSLLVFEDTGFESSGDGLGMFAYNDGTLTYRTASRSGTDFTGSTNRLVIDANSRISLSNNDSGTGNTIFGKSTATSLDAGSNYNVLIGGSIATGSMDNATHNVAVGSDALQDITTGDDNVAIGSSALLNITSGVGSVVIGRQAGDAITTTSGCTLVGYQSGTNINHNDAEGTVAFGYKTLELLTNGRYNTAVGYASLATSANGDRNTAVGFQSLGDVTGSSDGNNTAIGFNAGHTGTNNLTSGTENTLIGSSTRVSSATAVNQTVIGYNAVGAGDNSVVLGDSDVTAVLCASDGEAQLYASAIRFPATQVANGNANALDDYEEGTWTPTFVSASGHAPTISATYVNDFTKVGNVVTVSLYIAFSNDGGGTDGVQISGLPFAVPANTFHMVPAVFRRTNFTSNIMQYGLTVSSTDDIGFYYTNATGDRVGLTYDDIDVASNNLILTFTYLDA